MLNPIDLCIHAQRGMLLLRGRVYAVVVLFYLLFFFLFILRRMGKNKAQAHHTSTYFRTRRVSI